VPGGALTDRFSPRLVMLSSDFGPLRADGGTGDKEMLSADKGLSQAGA
jgi:hypothetical protein